MSTEKVYIKEVINEDGNIVVLNNGGRIYPQEEIDAMYEDAQRAEAELGL